MNTSSRARRGRVLLFPTQARAELEARGWLNPPGAAEDPKLRAFVDTHMAEYPEGVLSMRLDDGDAVQPRLPNENS